jgi:hypothetical protein
MPGTNTQRSDNNLAAWLESDDVANLVQDDPDGNVYLLARFAAAALRALDLAWKEGKVVGRNPEFWEHVDDALAQGEPLREAMRRE